MKKSSRKLNNKNVGALTKHQKGITLIALVITIIVLIILAGVAINLTLGDNGILRRAESARELSNKATVKEKIEIAIVEVQVEELTTAGRLTHQKLYETLESKDSNIILNEYTEGDTELTGTYNLNGKTYNFTIDSEFNVIIGDGEESDPEGEQPEEPEKEPVQIGDIAWNEDGTVSIEVSTELSGNIEYQVNGTDGEWLTGPLPSNLQHGDKLYVRVNDGTTATEPQEIEIKDTILPEEFTISVPEEDITYEAIKITSQGTEDNQTGISDYSFIVTKDGTVVKSITEQDVTEYEITGLEAETEYVVYMLAYDNARNVRKSNEVTITTKSIPVARMFGQYVNYGIDLDDDGDTTNDWQIFYKEEDPTSLNYGATYIIPDYYVPASKMTTPLSNTGLSYSSIYKIRFSNDFKDFIKTSEYDTIKQIFMYDYPEESNNNVYKVSRLLYADYWKDDFVTPQLQVKGGMAIGGPTINMWCASWNKAYPTEIIEPTIVTEGNGYEVNSSDQLYLTSYTGYAIDAPNVYFPTKSTPVGDSTNGYWIASPSNNSERDVLNIRCVAGLIFGNDLYNLGVRPVVYLPKEVTLTPDATTPNLWKINY